MKLPKNRVLLVAALVAGGLCLAACERKGPAERAGESLDRAGENIEEAAKDIGRDIEDATENIGR